MISNLKFLQLVDIIVSLNKLLRMVEVQVDSAILLIVNMFQSHLISFIDTLINGKNLSKVRRNKEIHLSISSLPDSTNINLVNFRHASCSSLKNKDGIGSGVERRIDS